MVTGVYLPSAFTMKPCRVQIVSCWSQTRFIPRMVVVKIIYPRAGWSQTCYLGSYSCQHSWVMAARQQGWHNLSVKNSHTLIHTSPDRRCGIPFLLLYWIQWFRLLSPLPWRDALLTHRCMSRNDSPLHLCRSLALPLHIEVNDWVSEFSHTGREEKKQHPDPFEYCNRVVRGGREGQHCPLASLQI